MHIFSIILFSTLSWTNPVTDSTANNSDVQLECKIESDLIDTLIYNGEQFVGTPYKYAGCSENGFDCSGLVHYIFGTMGADIARSSLNLSHLGYEINFDQVSKGDLVFFKGRNINSSSIGHVAYVVGGKGKDMMLLHATNRGVVVDKLSEISYYQKRFLLARRLEYNQVFDFYSDATLGK